MNRPAEPLAAADCLPAQESLEAHLTSIDLSRNAWPPNATVGMSTRLIATAGGTSVGEPVDRGL